MGKIEYFTFDGVCFKLHRISGVVRMRYTDDKGNKTILEDSDTKKLVANILEKFTEAIDERYS